LGNRVQHALRAFTPRDQKSVKAAADTFRGNPKLNIEKVITELGVGEALVSLLDQKGTPGVVERAFVCPPHGQIGPITPDQRKRIIDGSLVAGHYEQAIDRESAYEKLKGRADAAAGAGTPAPRGRQPESILEATAKSVFRAAGSQLGRQIVRGVLGSIFGGRR
jgi:DNA helicase HerA-like ATPase